MTSHSLSTTAFGIDIGGTGIKGGLVNLVDGTLIGERYRVDTPIPADPIAIAGSVEQIAVHAGYRGAFGVAFPGVVTHGIARTSANLDDSWQGVSLFAALGARLPGPVAVLNDADAAGMAESRYGAGNGQQGLVVVVTFGTGIGSALIYNGRLVPNAELGHLEIDGYNAESRAAASARERDNLSWQEWTVRANRYLAVLEDLLWPELIILGGGITKVPEKWVPLLNTRTPVKLAAMRNNAGIVGAAVAASSLSVASAEPNVGWG